MLRCFGQDFLSESAFLETGLWLFCQKGQWTFSQGAAQKLPDKANFSPLLLGTLPTQGTTTQKQAAGLKYGSFLASI